MDHDAGPAAIVRWVEARMREQRGPHPAVDADTELLRDARLDSLDIADLVIHLEDTAGVTIPATEVDAPSFRTPRTIADAARPPPQRGRRAMIRRMPGRVAWHLRERWWSLAGHDRYQRWIVRDLRSRGARIGVNCIVGAGAVVRGNIADSSVVLGNPGRVVMQTGIAEQLLVNHPDRMATLHLTARERERLLRSHFRMPA